MCYETRDAYFAAVCRERDMLKADNKRLNEAYEAMSRDLERMAQRVAELQRGGK